VPFPRLNDSEICAFIKLCASFDPKKFPAEGSKITGFLRFLTAGKDDPLVDVSEYAEQFFDIVNKKDQVFGVSLKKSDLENSEELKDINLNLNNLQENFVFLFEKTGHNVHKKYGRVLGHLIRKYVALLEIVEKKQKEPPMPKL